MSELADVLHEGQCGRHRCKRYQPGNVHHDYYESQAQRISDKLTPLIGAANVLPVVRIVLDETI